MFYVLACVQDSEPLLFIDVKKGLNVNEPCEFNL